MFKSLCLVLAAACLLVGCRSSTPPAAADPGALLAKGGKILDVRSPGEFQSGHLPGAINVPVDQLKTALPLAVPDKQTPLLVHCRSGVRSARAVPILQQLGYTNLVDLGSLENARRVCAAQN